jgi:hypothetical protein
MYISLAAVAGTLVAVGYGARCTFLENFDSTIYFFENHDKINKKFLQPATSPTPAFLTLFSSLLSSTWDSTGFLDSHSTTQTLTTCTHTHPYEYTYAKPTPMSTSEGLSTDRSEDSRSHHWHLVVDGNVAFHLTHNTGKSGNKSRKRCEHQDLNPSG